MKGMTKILFVTAAFLALANVAVAGPTGGPPVPDGGSSALLLMAALAGLSLVRKFVRR